MSARQLIGSVVEIDGEVYRAIATTDRETITFRKVGAGPCPSCGQEPDRSYVVGSPNYQADVKPVPTIEGQSR